MSARFASREGAEGQFPARARPAPAASGRCRSEPARDCTLAAGPAARSVRPPDENPVVRVVGRTHEQIAPGPNQDGRGRQGFGVAMTDAGAGRSVSLRRGRAGRPAGTAGSRRFRLHRRRSADPLIGNAVLWRLVRRPGSSGIRTAVLEISRKFVDMVCSFDSFSYFIRVFWAEDRISVGTAVPAWHGLRGAASQPRRASSPPPAHRERQRASRFHDSTTTLSPRSPPGYACGPPWTTGECTST